MDNQVVIKNWKTLYFKGNLLYDNGKEILRRKRQYGNDV